MMNNIFKQSIRIFMLLITLCISGCGQHSVTIVFDSNGGTEVSSITAVENASVTKPSDPTKEGYTFSGWYSDSGLTEAYAFTTMPSTNITLYAGWSINQYTIGFEENGGSLIAPIEQDFGTLLTKPADPMKAGYTFTGWYSDSGLTEAYAFTTMPSSNISLYAGWSINRYTISFEENGGSVVSSIVQDYNTIVTKPTDPIKEGYTFSGWYSNSDLSEEYTFSTMPSSNITLYASWMKVPEDFVYEIIDDEAIIISYSGNSESLVVPDSIGGAPVVKINDEAFVNNQTLTNITLGRFVTAIGNGTFSGCSSLTSIEMPDSVMEIGDYAFYGCSSLMGIEIPGNVINLGHHAFDGCSNLASAVINHGVENLGNNAFADCVGLTSVEIPDSLTAIGNSTFYNCTGLTSIVIPNSVTSIGFGVFRGCANLVGITIPFTGNTRTATDTYSNFVYIFGSSSADVPSSLEEVVVTDITSVKDSAFSFCSGIESIVIPNSVTSIEDYAFRGCSSLTNFVIPSYVTSIGDYAFTECSSLTGIEIPGGVTSIGLYVFYNCSSLSSIVVPDGLTGIGKGAFYGCSGLVSIVIPDGLTNIGEYAFFSCGHIDNMFIPESVIVIERNAFYGCSNLSIYCEAKSRPAGWHDNWNPDNRPVVWEYTE